MEPYIQISKINDFIFCPKSIYFHGIYENFSEKTYHQSPQVKGRIKHESIDYGKYSTAKRYLQGLEVYSEKYNLAGKIDIYDKEEKSLIERKNKIVKIYDGYRYQLYAQYFCMTEMNYEVKKLYFYSMTDNKKYEIDLPKGDELERFENTISEMRSFDMLKNNFKQSPAKCAKCIYAELCQ
jgi:CRISPR-associated exonuclease Cas4